MDPEKVPVPSSSRPSSPSPMLMKYFLAIFLLSAILLGRLLWPFWSILVLSFLLTNLFRPIYSFFARRMSNPLASALTCFLIVAVVFIPLVLLVGSLAGEAMGLYNWGRNTQIGFKLQAFIQNSPYIAHLQLRLHELGLDFNPTMVTDTLTYLAKEGGLFLYKQASNWAANIMQFLALFFMMILVIFFLLMDLPRLKDYLIRLSPLPDDEDRLLIRKFEEIAGAILKGNGMCGLLQGVLGGAMFSIMGLNSPILWGCIMAVLAFLPIFGIGLVMIPTAIIIGVNGHIGLGIFFFIYYLVLSFSVEYFLKPKLVGSQVEMHTLLVLLAILGGLAVYGILGIIYGPLIVTAFLTLSDIYMKTYEKHFSELGAGPPVTKNTE